MISKYGGIKEEKRVIADGIGEIALNHYYTQEDMLDKARICAELTIEPGNLIGKHAHTGEAEFFYVLEGELVSINPDGSEESFKKGDMMFTGGGSFHSLRNDSQKPAKMLAIVVL